MAGGSSKLGRPGVVHRFSGFLFDFRIKGQALPAQIRPCTASFSAKICQNAARSLHCKGFLIQSQAQQPIRTPARCHSLIFDCWPGSSSHPIPATTTATRIITPQHHRTASTSLLSSNQRSVLQGDISITTLLHACL